jgi:hypothetical protein
MSSGILKWYLESSLEEHQMEEGYVPGPEDLLHDQETILEEAQRLITGERNQTYDHPLDNFERIAAIWSVVLGIKVTPEQVGLCMVGVKLAREAYLPKRDNLVDGAGYFGTVQMVRDERLRRAQEN